mmetsp:Transcript_40089/g.55706  ORF Transcript_40089/g.55706 Transcript_40089/m.55706 type:complete len:336 (+) Transcript_40089:152-1159(+)|eukprot:CAMPEP_0196572466 /NCGR_PEP_ID=MMETSP1081-20130531/2519_1 /TAXON_ID=36882 /ORGANISM="Pyramimonas amylifera, Strain CCMP720" /LENGTH=335 /DNA_ID=CAMNT_0041889801 /DNA_START=152 /DNA_END=1159 /DNA_ORIENTATION=+
MELNPNNFYGSALPRPYLLRNFSDTVLADDRRKGGALTNNEILLAWSANAPWQAGGILKGKSTRGNDFGSIHTAETSGASAAKREKLATGQGRSGMVTSASLDLNIVRQRAKDEKKSRQKTDFRKPKKARTAWQCFMQSQRELGLGASLETSARLYKQLTEEAQEHFVRLAAEDKARFDKEMSAYQPKPAKTRKSLKVSKPINKIRKPKLPKGKKINTAKSGAKSTKLSSKLESVEPRKQMESQADKVPVMKQQLESGTGVASKTRAALPRSDTKVMPATADRKTKKAPKVVQADASASAVSIPKASAPAGKRKAEVRVTRTTRSVKVSGASSAK